jgi:hypothetical protein
MTAGSGRETHNKAGSATDQPVGRQFWTPISGLRGQYCRPNNTRGLSVVLIELAFVLSVATMATARQAAFSRHEKRIRGRRSAARSTQRS